MKAAVQNQVKETVQNQVKKCGWIKEKVKVGGYFIKEVRMV